MIQLNNDLENEMNLAPLGSDTGCAALFIVLGAAIFIFTPLIDYIFRWWF